MAPTRALVAARASAGDRLLATFLASVLASTLAVVLAVLASVGTATPAAAHAVVTASAPADRATLEAAPPAVSITFSESVSISLGGIEVLDGDGNRADEGATEQPQADTIRAPLRSGLGDGTYIANYRIVSADGHPIVGAIVFGVGVQVDEGAAAAGTKRTDPLWETVGGIARFLSYFGALSAAGIAFFLAFVGDGGPGTVALGRLVRRLAVVGAGGTLAGLSVQAALATGRGPGAVFDPEVFREVLNGGLGWQTAAVLAGLAAVVIVPAVDDLLAQVLALYGGLATVGGFVLWGHATEAEQKGVAMVSDVTHAGVAAFWIGGAIALLVVLRTRLAGRSEGGDGEYAESPVLSTARIVVRFSTGAAIAVALLWMAGTVLAWQTVGSIENLVGSSYGRLLLVKVLLVVGVLAVASFNRFRLVPSIIDEAEPESLAADAGRSPLDADEPAPTSPPLAPDLVEGHADDGTTVDEAPPRVAVQDVRDPAWRRLTSTLRLEVVGLVGVLLVTGFLVSITPPRLGAGQADQPVTQSAAIPNGQLTIVVSPALTGVNSIHLTYTDAAGVPADLARSADVELSLPDKNIGPIPRKPVKAGTGHFTLDGLRDFAVAGTWTVAVVSRIGEFDVKRTEFSVPITRS